MLIWNLKLTLNFSLKGNSSLIYRFVEILLKAAKTYFDFVQVGMFTKNVGKLLRVR